MTIIHISEDKNGNLRTVKNGLTEKEKKEMAITLALWCKSDSHKRGCLLEALMGEFERGTVSKIYVIELLNGIAAWLK